jgi:hypothetical protein
MIELSTESPCRLSKAKNLLIVAGTLAFLGSAGVTAMGLNLRALDYGSFCSLKISDRERNCLSLEFHDELKIVVAIYRDGYLYYETQR